MDSLRYRADDAELKALKRIILRCGERRLLPKGACFVRCGERSDEVAYIIRGGFKYTRPDSRNREHIYSFAFEGELIASYAAARNDCPAPLDICALEESAIVVIRIGEHPSFFQCDSEGRTYVWKFAEVLAFQHLQRFVFLASTTPKERYRQLTAQYPGILNRVSLREVARYIGTRPETLSRMRTALLREEGDEGAPGLI